MRLRTKGLGMVISRRQSEALAGYEYCNKTVILYIIWKASLVP